MESLILLFKDGASAKEMRETVEKEGLVIKQCMRETLEAAGITTLPNSFPSICIVEISGSSRDWISRLSDLPNIESVELNSKMKLS